MVQADREPSHILVVDDDDRIRDLLKRFLSLKGYRVSAANHAEAARNLMTAFDFDLIVLDVMMPGEDGFSFTERIRDRHDTPIILLTARGLPNDRIEGLALGADDYVSKPFEPEELALRIQAILRREGRKPRAGGGPVSFGPNVFYPASGDLTRDGDPVRLTEGEAGLLSMLTARLGETISRAALARDGGEVAERSIDVQVTRLRKKIEDDPKEPRWLLTVRGRGYRLVVRD
jgi:two-component system, OmpR family, phosphate regulon response regulator OmpR